jgi:hypothetical protein
MSNLSLNIVIVIVLLVIILLVFQLMREPPKKHKQVSTLPAYKREHVESSELYNVYWIGDSHSDSGAVYYREDVCEFIGSNLVFPIPPSGPTQVILERYNEKGISTDGKSRNFYVAKEAGLQLENAWKMISKGQKLGRRKGFLYDFSISGSSMFSNTRLSSLHPTLDPNNNPPFKWFSVEEETDECLDFISLSNIGISKKDVFWFSGLYNDIVFIALLGVSFPNNLGFVDPPITPLNIPTFIGRVIAKQVELINKVYQAGGRRVVVELWESIDDAVIANLFWHKSKLAFGGAAIADVQLALTGMIAGLKATIMANLSANWPELDIKFSNISGQLKEILDNPHLYGINLDFPAGPYETMIEQNPLTHPPQPSTSFDLVRRTRNLYHWDDTHLTSHSASIQAKFAASILSSKPDDAKIGNFGPAGFC